MPRLKEFLDDGNLDALLMVGSSQCDLDIFYLSGFSSTDPYALLATKGASGAGGVSLLVSSMELGRATKESAADDVVSTSEYGIREKLRSAKKPEDAYAEVLKEFLKDRGVRRLCTPRNFPAGLYVSLAGEFEVAVVDSPTRAWRAVKGPGEIEAIRAAQGACQEAMDVAVSLIGRSKPEGGILLYGGEPLTSDGVRAAIDVALLERGCEAADTIVTGGMDSANPHAVGNGPLPADAPIVIDIFPRSKSSRYFADMTRTVLRGEASPEVTEMYDAVLCAQLAGLGAIRAGVTGREVHLEVCRVFEEMGHPVDDQVGFIHSTGHGVGLAVHEKPTLSEVGELLEVNNVVTVEPGLYYPEIGGVRLEDLVVVTAGGCDNLTRYPRQLVL